VVLVICFAWLQGIAQTAITVTGKVTDEKGASVAGATITEKGTRNVTTTLDDGSFTIKTKLKARLVVSYVGYEPYEVDAKEGLKIALNPSSQALSDVVVTGVGVATSKKKVPIDVATVNSKDFAASATTNVQQQLDGQIAGANIQQTSGTPGATFLITLRGINDLSNPNPIILVDGVLITNLNNIDPAIVDRVEVVKGPAGAMLYGAKGANGVIQIFTKKGSLNGRPTITVTSKSGIDHILTGNHDILSKLHHYVVDANGNILDQAANPIVRDASGEWSDPQVPDPTVNPNLQNNLNFNIPIYDHLKQGYRQAKTFTNSVSVTGGGTLADYSFTASQLNQQDVLSNAFSRSNISVNLGLHPFRGFTFRTITQGIVGYEDLLNGSRFNILTAYPFVDFGWKDSTGHYPFKTNISSNGYNTLSENQWHQVNDQSLEIFQNFNLNYKFPRFFELDIKYGLEYSHVDQDNYWANQSSAVQPNQYWGPSRNGAIVNQFDRHFNQDGLYSAFFRTDFEKDFHSRLPIRTTTQVTYEYIRQDERAYYAEGVGLPPYPPASIELATIKTSGISFSGNQANQTSITFGALINQTVEWGNLFGISGGVRSDYGSAFGSAGNAANFPRGTVYFRPSELMTNQQPWLPDWKLRAAYGAAGIQPGPYDRQITLTNTTLGSGVAISLPSTANNNALLLATNYELEVGTDATFTPFSGEWAHKFVLNASYWHRTLNKTYQNAVDAPSTGYAARLDNLSDISSHGVDLALDVSIYNGPDVTWDMSTRWGYYRATVTKIANGQPIIDGGFAIMQGKPLGLFYVQTLLTKVDQLGPDGKTPLIPVASQGNYVVASNGFVVNTTTNAAKYTPANDLSVVGHAYPDFTSSMINRVTLYKKFTISFQFDWTHGNSIYNITKQWLYTPVGGSGGQGANSSDFDKPITVGTNRGAFVNYYQSLYNLVLPSSPFIENGSFIRLKDVSVTYDLSRYVAGSHAINRLSVTASGRNLLTFTKYSGLDPENTGAFDAQGDNLAGNRLGAFAGVDYFGTPNLRSYMFTLNVGF
jgi:TonB-linked SusC/RagA family outer membrane protein